jgi:hypothetical protein
MLLRVKRPTDETDLLSPNSAGGLPICLHGVLPRQREKLNYGPAKQIHKFDINIAFHYQYITHQLPTLAYHAMERLKP